MGEIFEFFAEIIIEMISAANKAWVWVLFIAIVILIIVAVVICNTPEIVTKLK